LASKSFVHIIKENIRLFRKDKIFSKLNYYQVTVYIKGRKRPLQGIREHFSDDNSKVYHIILQKLPKYYLKNDIIKIDINRLPQSSEQVCDHIERKQKPVMSRTV
jgi:hypothetical protein